MEKHKIDKIWWIGGSPGAGKTSFAKALGEKHNIYVYHCDEHYKEHIKMSEPIIHPTICKLAPLSEEEFWMRPVERQYIESIRFYKEEFDIMQNNIGNILEQHRNIIIEGCIILPELLKELQVPLNNMVWMVPTPEFQRKQHLNRGKWVYDILEQCNNPMIAFNNWMERDELFAKYIIHQCDELSFPCYITDGTLNKKDVFNIIEKHFIKNSFNM